MHDHADHTAHGGHGDHHAAMIADFKQRLWISLVLTIPIIAISPMMGMGQLVHFPGDTWVALALAQADVGIAVGAGTDVAIETADIVLVRSNPLDVANVIGLARATYRMMIENLAWATGYNVVAIPLAAGVLYKAGIVLSPAVGAVLMSASTVIVALNARSLKMPGPGRA